MYLLHLCIYRCQVTAKEISFKRHEKKENNRYNKCINDDKISKLENIIYFYTQKGLQKYLKNYHPISHQSVIYKLFTNVLELISDTLNFNQRRQQAAYAHKPEERKLINLKKPRLQIDFRVHIPVVLESNSK